VSSNVREGRRGRTCSWKTPENKRSLLIGRGEEIMTQVFLRGTTARGRGRWGGSFKGGREEGNGLFAGL